MSRALSDTTESTTATPFSPFSSGQSIRSVASDASGTSEESADLGAFHSIFLALSQLHVHANSRGTANTTAAASPVLHSPSLSSFASTGATLSSRSRSSDPEAFVTESEIRLSDDDTNSDSGSVGTLGDSPTSALVGEGTEAPVWTHHPVGTYIASDFHHSDGSPALSVANSSADGKDNPNLGDLESALEFIAKERARLALKLDAGLTTVKDSARVNEPGGRPENGKHVSTPRRNRRNRRRGRMRRDSINEIEGGPEELDDIHDGEDEDEDDNEDARTETVGSPSSRERNSPRKNPSANSKSKSVIHPHDIIDSYSIQPSRPLNASSSRPRRSRNKNLTPLQTRLISLSRRLAREMPADLHSLTRLTTDPKGLILNGGLGPRISDNQLVQDGFFDPGSSSSDSFAHTGESLLHVFIDHSNILIGFLEWYKRQSAHQTPPSSSPSKSKPKPKLSHHALLVLLERGRRCARRVLVASSPLHQSLDAVVRMGYEVSVLQRVEIKEGSGSGGNSKGRWGTEIVSAGRGRGGFSVNPEMLTKGPTKGSGTGTSTDSDAAQPSHPQPKTRVRGVGQGHRRNPSAPSSFPSLPPPIPIRHRGSHRRQQSSSDQILVSPPGRLGGHSMQSGLPNAAKPRFREEAVDELLQLKILQSLLDSPSPPPPGSTIVLATGDGASSQFNPDGFLGCIRRAIERGWKVELVGWEDGTSRAWKELRDFGNGNLTIIGLEKWGSELVE